jgi:hypothetical protein
MIDPLEGHVPRVTPEELHSFDYSAIELRVLASVGVPHRQIRNVLFGMHFGMGSQKLYELLAREPVNAETQLAADILIFERWQAEERGRIRRENAAIAFAAAEHGIASRATRRPVLSSPTGRLKQSEPELQPLRRKQ